MTLKRAGGEKSLVLLLLLILGKSVRCTTDPPTGAPTGIPTNADDQQLVCGEEEGAVFLLRAECQDLCLDNACPCYRPDGTGGCYSPAFAQNPDAIASESIYDVTIGSAWEVTDADGPVADPASQVTSYLDYGYVHGMCDECDRDSGVALWEGTAEASRAWEQLDAAHSHLTVEMRVWFLNTPDLTDIVTVILWDGESMADPYGRWTSGSSLGGFGMCAGDWLQWNTPADGTHVCSSVHSTAGVHCYQDISMSVEHTKDSLEVLISSSCEQSCGDESFGFSEFALCYGLGPCPRDEAANWGATAPPSAAPTPRSFALCFFDAGSCSAYANESTGFIDSYHDALFFHGGVLLEDFPNAWEAEIDEECQSACPIEEGETDLAVNVSLVFTGRLIINASVDLQRDITDDGFVDDLSIYDDDLIFFDDDILPPITGPDTGNQTASPTAAPPLQLEEVAGELASDLSSTNGPLAGYQFDITCASSSGTGKSGQSDLVDGGRRKAEEDDDGNPGNSGTDTTAILEIVVEVDGVALSDGAAIADFFVSYLVSEEGLLVFEISTDPDAFYTSGGNVTIQTYFVWSETWLEFCTVNTGGSSCFQVEVAGDERDGSSSSTPSSSNDEDDGGLDRKEATLVAVLYSTMALLGGGLMGLSVYRTRVTLKRRYHRSALAGALGLKQSESDLHNSSPLFNDVYQLRPSEVALEKFLAAGSGGRVYKGRFRGAAVAVKELSVRGRTRTRSAVFVPENKESDEDAAAPASAAEGPSLDVVIAFKNEARLLLALSHPGVVRLYGTCETEGSIFIIMEHCQENLAEHLKRADRDLTTFLGIAIQLAEVVAFIHSRDICHRDLKCENVLVDSRGQLKLCDLGLSRLQRHLEFCQTQGVGTPHFMAPEIVGAGADDDRDALIAAAALGVINPEDCSFVFGYDGFKADIYALAVMLFTVWTRRKPYRGRGELQILFGVTENNLRPAPPWPHVTGYAASGFAAGPPPEIAALCERGWAQEPDERPTAGELCSLLSAIDEKYQQEALQNPMIAATPDEFTGANPMIAVNNVPPGSVGGRDRRLTGGDGYASMRRAAKKQRPTAEKQQVECRWRKVEAAEGAYFWNTESGVTQYEEPEEPYDSEPLWQEATDEIGEPYWWNTATRETTREPPAEMI